jgi:hypothetical protein
MAGCQTVSVKKSISDIFLKKAKASSPKLATMPRVVKMDIEAAKNSKA